MDKIPNILLVEDDPNDVEITQRAFDKLGLECELNVVDNGIKALQYLFREGDYANAKVPDLVLLDINLPFKSGLDVLREIKTHKVLHSIPIVILSSSEAANDIEHAYDAHANSYICKKSNFTDFLETLKSLRSFWFGEAKLPSELKR